VEKAGIKPITSVKSVAAVPCIT